MKGDANDEAASDLLRCPARTGRALERRASQAKAGSSGSSTLRLWTPSQMRGLSSWAAHWVMGKRSSCSSWLPIVSKLSRPGSRMIRGRLRGCCTRPRSSAGKSFSRRASSERPHGRRCSEPSVKKAEPLTELSKFPLTEFPNLHPVWQKEQDRRSFVRVRMLYFSRGATRLLTDQMTRATELRH